MKSTFILTTQIGALALTVVVLFVTIHFIATPPTGDAPVADVSLAVASPAVEIATSTSTSSSSSSLPRVHTTTTIVKKANAGAKQSEPPVESNQIHRIVNPYTNPPLSFNMVNAQARGALVNILCSTKNGALRPISGSGVIIDPRGVILTNAHVAQYVLLSESTQINLTCEIRTGSPAKARWTAQVLYMPPVWVQQHARDITSPTPLGTGEHDYALLLISAVADAPSLAPDTREAIAFVDDELLVASYPAEFLGAAAESGLYSATSITTVQQLLTLTGASADVLSLGGVIEAQSGSSGGAIVNQWGRLVGLITTTSTGATTAERDLRAITLSYISRDLKAQTGSDLSSMLAGDLQTKVNTFSTSVAPGLIQALLNAIVQR